MGKKINFSVIGAGYWGPNLIRVIEQNYDCDLKVVIDLNSDNLANIKRQFPGVETSDNIDSVFNLDIDLVVIATPPETHYEIAVKMLSNNLNILVTKPLCLDLSEAKFLYNLAKKNRLEIFMDETFIFSNQVIALKKYVNNTRDFGELTFIDSSRVNLGLFQQNTNVIWDLAPHDIAISSYVLDEYPDMVRATSVNGLKIPGINESYATCEYKFSKSQVLMTSLISWLSPVKSRRMVFGGTKQTIIYDHLDYESPLKIFNQEILAKKNGEITNYDYSIGSQFIPHIKIREPLVNEIEEIVKFFRKGAKLFAEKKHSYNSVSILKSLTDSSKEGGAYKKVKLL
jgi:predicted dehydrogenase